MQDIFWFLRNRHLKLPEHNLYVGHKIVTVVHYIIIFKNQIISGYMFSSHRVYSVQFNNSQVFGSCTSFPIF